ncbi:MAG TPA: hypothetical protein ENF89_01120 [Candidatus Bathyarchaeota archaeon]|nr:hypothetical protein [Candidatus Bathyarchaeota archaeon]
MIVGKVSSLTDLSVDLAGVRLENPLIIASGILSQHLLRRCIDAGVGAVTTKSITPKPMEGHPPPSIIDVDVGLINAVGLRNPGIEAFEDEMRRLVEYAHGRGVKVIGSVAAPSIDGYVEVAGRMEDYGADIVELNVSCPTIEEVHSMGSSPKTVGRLVGEVDGALCIPLSVKLSPELREFTDIAEEAISSGADILSLVNTISPATSIDIWRGEIRLRCPGGVGGLSGKALKPIALARVLMTYREMEAPIIASGGVSSWEDVVEMIYAGATAVSFLTALLKRGEPTMIGEMLRGLRNFMERLGFGKVEEMRGYALRKRS